MIQQSIRNILNPRQLTFISYFIVLAIVAYASYASRFSQLDDAMIYLRYIRNFFDGKGLVYNEGVYFNGLTSPLYTYIVIAINYLVYNLQYSVLAIYFVTFVSAILIARSLFDSLGWKILPSIILIACSKFFYTTIGMETSFMLMLTALALWLYVHSKFFLLGLTLGLCFLVRGETIFLSVMILADYIYRNRHFPHIKYFIVPTLLVGLNMLFNYYYYGTFLPSTVGAKIAQGQSGLWGGGSKLLFIRILYMKDWFFNGNAILPIVLALAAIAGSLLTINHTVTRIIIGYIILISLFYVGLNIPNYHWYYAPYYFWGLIYAGIAFSYLLEWCINTYSHKKMYAIVAAALLVFVAVKYIAIIATYRGEPKHPYVTIGTWLKNNTPEDTVLATVEIGFIGWYSERYLVDILGLVNSKNAAFIGKGDTSSWLEHHDVDYILIHNPPWPHEKGTVDAMHAGRFVPLDDFPFDGYRLLVKSDSTSSR